MTRKIGKHPALGAPYSPTGRKPSDPEMQNIKPPLTQGQKDFAEWFKGKLHDYQKPLYDEIMQHGSPRMTLFGMDLASGPDQTILALISGDGKTRDLVLLDDLKTANASRKQARETIARALCLLAAGHGAQVERTDDRSCITLQITLAGVGALIDIDTDLGGDTSIISWHNDRNMQGPVRHFTARFSKLVGDGMFARRHHKASSLPGDWYSLAMMLDAGLLLAARSEAFEPG